MFEVLTQEAATTDGDGYDNRQLHGFRYASRPSNNIQPSVFSTSGTDEHMRVTRAESSTISNNSQAQHPLSPRTSSHTQSSNQRRMTATGGEASHPEDATSTTPFQFEPPLRSIFASGQPTSSLSSNTARASLSTANTNSMSRPLAALTNSRANRGTFIRSADFTSLTMPMTETIPGAQKDVDDLSSNYITSPDVSGNSTSQALSSLFTASDGHTPGLSRHTTYGRSLSSTPKTAQDSSTLGGHLFNIGFMEGRHSDVTLKCFGRSYRLHKLLLERAPFFSSAFSGGWAESSAREMTLIPEDIDSNITQTAFELAIKRIYGTVITQDEESNAIGLFATACWLDMPDLVNICIDYLLRQMRSPDLHVLIKLVTNNYYGKAGDRILSSAKAMLCRDGYEMNVCYWDFVPAEIICEIVGGDPFYIPGEWERWCLALRLLNRRLRRLAIESGLVSTEGYYIQPKPRHLQHSAVRPAGYPDTVRSDMNDEDEDEWRVLYSHPDVLPLLQLLDFRIHYMHLRFEQIQYIRYHRDILDVPVLPDKVISDALWMSMELRQTIVTADENDLELGLAQYTQDTDGDECALLNSQTDLGKSKRRQHSSDNETVVEQSADYQRPINDEVEARKFWIPTSDVSAIIGAASETYATGASPAMPQWKHRSQRLSATFDAADVQWPPDMALGGLGGSIFDTSRALSSHSRPRFSFVPPFRFCAEFPNPRTLKEKKRLYSQTVFYAGSMFNLYIQRINTSKTQQLGVYLHRAKDKEPLDDPLALSGVGQCEYDLSIRKSDHRRRKWPSNPSDSDAEDLLVGAHDDEPASSTGKTVKSPPPPPKISPMLQLRAQRLPQTNTAISNDRISMKDEDIDQISFRFQSSSKTSNSALPPYVDARSTIKTYFKIYSPSKAGRLLSVYESAPDSFTFGKSWGWKSNQMVLDDGIGDELTNNGSKCSTTGTGTIKDGRIRYMVVLGNV